jgi:tRNA A37 methylthiotransferase MiaB
MDVDWDAEWDGNTPFFAKRDKDGLTINAWSTRFTKVVTQACNARSLTTRRVASSDDQLRRYKKPQVVSSIVSCIGPKGVASLHKLLSEPDGPTGNTDIERLSDQIDDAQAKFEVAAHTDSIAKGDKVYRGFINYSES